MAIRIYSARNPYHGRFWACLAVAIASIGHMAFAQTDYETPPTFSTQSVLGEVPLAGPGYELDSGTVNDGTMNHFQFQTSSGPQFVAGNELARQRLYEFSIIPSLDEIKGSEAYAKGIKAAGKGTYSSMKTLVTSPGETLSAVPAGVGRFFGNLYRSAKPGGGSEYDDGTMKAMNGFSAAKRALAFQAGVDPYSSNEVLQEALSDVAWASFAGGMTLSVARFVAVPTVINMPLRVGEISVNMAEIVRDESPANLQKINGDKLRALGAADEQVKAFLSNTWYSPTHQTVLCEALSRLNGVSGVSVYLDSAVRALSENEAYFFQRNAELLAALHAGGTQLIRLHGTGRLPIAEAEGGCHLVAAVDYLHWTSNVANSAQDIRAELPPDLASKPLSLWIGGQVSERAKAELSAQGFLVQEDAIARLLKSAAAGN